MKLAVLAVALLAAGLVAAGGADARLASFKTPSGNIGCVYDSASGGSLRCDILSGLKPKPSRPRGCDLDWGDSLTLARTGRARVLCHGDTAVLPSAPILRYGTTWSRGPFTCTSRRAGLTCENAAEHGFFLSRQSWQRF